MLSAATFALFCVACTVLAFVRHPIYGLYFYLSATYVFPPGRWWAYMLGDLRWSLLAAAVTVAAVLFGSAKLRPKPFWLTKTPALILLLYALWMLIQTSWALDINTHLRGTTQFFKYIVAFWFVYRVVDNEENVRNLLLAHLLGCTLLGLYAYVAGRIGGRLDGVGGPGIDDANTLGMYFATGAITAIGLLLVERGWRRWLTFGCLAFVVNGLILTNTRGAFLGLLAGALVLALCKAREHRRTFWLLAAAGVLGTSLLIDEKFIDRMSTIQEAITDTQDADFSAVSRMTLAAAQMEMFRDYPMGTGWRGTETLSPRYLEEKFLSGGGRSSHNTFLTTLVEQGIPGAILYIWLTLWTIRAILGLRARQRGASPQFVTLAATISSVLAVVFAAGFTADFLMAEVQYWMLAALVSTIGFAGKRSGEALGAVHVRSDRTVAEGPT
jgi:O-antigen ligase